MKKLTMITCLFFFLIACKKKKQSLTKITAKTILIDSNIPTNDAITRTIAPYKKKMLKEITTVLSHTDRDLTRLDGKMQSSLGNLLADLCFDIANPIFKTKMHKNIDFAMFNYGGIRAGIPAGKITNKHAFELMPFENSLVVTELSGEKIIELINYFINNQKAHPLSKHIALTISENNFTLNINGVPFDKNKNYFVLTSDYLQNGGDKMIFFKAPISLTKLDYKMRDAIITYFKNTSPITSELDNRVIIK
ncbi:5'-nucleotidase C-terminal domain-containing protein [Tenacibaculum maritimum]|uniref:5'-nucleotidase C-terminal domain-containing protein n=1 Tax=Tenacibaculum maritimum TaxID=107401 RepID=UPI0012E56F6B|nr:5'-nucleotidase [Tenacibaculum maritimum]CAA0220046.1 Putative 2, 3-cyclic phosphodiesterase [Tenacibaculum maritimum]CAA0242322.1 Putative 2, 3-cyclic phosphodiesterase [Tenacibaculum maritimum]